MGLIPAGGKQRNVECKTGYRDKLEMIDERLNKKLIASGMVGGTIRDEGKAGWDWN